MRISEILSPSLVKLDVQAQDKEELFEEMVQLFVNDGLITDRESAVTALLEREAKMSTGISRWLGLPHGKLVEARNILIALGVSKKGIDYDALDGEPVYVIITIFAEIGNPGPHIQALAEISRLFAIPEVITKIRQARTPQQVIDIIKNEE
ncbi:MAG: PTS sugar transporter subunit IIA [Lentisphaeria bacterium]|jgi:mannitol/fructose-specific phosphotransferase system IIA component (Ntr-type)|nr:PTS sugar transporter subunit IIA [Lentisphaeria bacterium]